MTSISVIQLYAILSVSGDDSKSAIYSRLWEKARAAEDEGEDVIPTTTDEENFIQALQVANQTPNQKRNYAQSTDTTEAETSELRQLLRKGQRIPPSELHKIEVHPGPFFSHQQLHAFRELGYVETKPGVDRLASAYKSVAVRKKGPKEVEKNIEQLVQDMMHDPFKDTLKYAFANHQHSGSVVPDGQTTFDMAVTRTRSAQSQSTNDRPSPLPTQARPSAQASALQGEQTTFLHYMKAACWSINPNVGIADLEFLLRQNGYLESSIYHYALQSLTLCFRLSVPFQAGNPIELLARNTLTDTGQDQSSFCDDCAKTIVYLWASRMLPVDKVDSKWDQTKLDLKKDLYARWPKLLADSTMQYMLQLDQYFGRFYSTGANTLAAEPWIALAAEVKRFDGFIRERWIAELDEVEALGESRKEAIDRMVEAQNFFSRRWLASTAVPLTE